MKTTQILIAGFGGQGVLFAGKFLAYKGLTENMQVSWLPSYGPEMRGGTANCSVVLSDSPVGSPIITNPDVLIAMNLPSLQKFVDTVVPGGKIIIDSTGQTVAGTIPSNGAIAATFDPLSQSSVAIAAGYTSGGAVTLTSDLETALAAI